MRLDHRFAVAVLALFASAPAGATSSLSFDGGGYSIELEVGDSTRPVIASVRFHAPGDREGVVLARDRVTVEAFDVVRRVLVLHHAAGRDGVAAFTLSVHGAEAVFETGTRRTTSMFDWSM
ncbi:hypothetical protein FHW12_001002 [Dokdonella fugitiva]|uniref:Uncharacterized protein n=1 Tax=Dokdonella fugitiva TaxID=328517 RepID=A0A839F3N4_9GAMM|nr:hypothetical protein [Dokdonella fugitiva]MBA8886811.1 hypothetical protein [Dokdonella fugitiva]